MRKKCFGNGMIVPEYIAILRGRRWAKRLILNGSVVSKEWPPHLVFKLKIKIF